MVHSWLRAEYEVPLSNYRYRKLSMNDRLIASDRRATHQRWRWILQGFSSDAKWCILARVGTANPTSPSHFSALLPSHRSWGGEIPRIGGWNQPSPPPATAASSASTVASFEESMKMIRIRFPISLILIPEKWKMENPRGKIGKKKKKTNKSNTGKENEDISKPRQIEFCGRKWPTLAMETLRKFTKSITDPKLATVTCVRKVKVEKSIAAKPPRHHHRHHLANR